MTVKEGTPNVTPEMVEAAARAVGESEYGPALTWGGLSEITRAYYRTIATTALTAALAVAPAPVAREEVEEPDRSAVIIRDVWWRRNDNGEWEPEHGLGGAEADMDDALTQIVLLKMQLARRMKWTKAARSAARGGA